MYANDRGKWSVRIDCLSNPSLSCPTQAFDMEAEAESYARSCSDRIMRHTMNERYSLMNRMYPDRLVMTEGLLDWFFGLMGKFVNVFFGKAGEGEKNVALSSGRQNNLFQNPSLSTTTQTPKQNLFLPQPSNFPRRRLALGPLQTLARSPASVCSENCIPLKNLADHVEYGEFMAMVGRKIEQLMSKSIQLMENFVFEASKS